MVFMYQSEWKDVGCPLWVVTDGTHHWWIQINVSCKKCNVNIMRVGYTILDDESESDIDENWCLIDNQSTCNAFINWKYLSHTIYAPDGQYLCVHCNVGVTYTKKIGDLPRYSNHLWCNSKGVANILSLVLVQKHHLVTYNSQDGN